MHFVVHRWHDVQPLHCYFELEANNQKHADVS